MCTHTYTQTHPPACACKHARKHVLVKSTHVGHAMGWRANARANASRRTAQRARMPATPIGEIWEQDLGDLTALQGVHNKFERAKPRVARSAL